MLCEEKFIISMGSIPNHRLSQSQILGHCRTLCIALAEQKVQNIRVALKEKKFVRDLIIVVKYSAILLGMTLVSELAALRVLSVLLLIIFLHLVWRSREMQRSRDTFDPRNQ